MMSPSNNSTSFQCSNLLENKYTVLLINEVTRVLQGVFFGLSLLLLLALLRKKAFNNPAKRFGLLLMFTLSLFSLSRAVVYLYPASSLPQWLCVVTMVFYCLGRTAILYLVALPVALLLQVSTPIIPEGFRHKISAVVPLIEVLLQIVILVSSLLINGLQLLDSKNSTAFCKKCATLYYYEVYALSLSVLALFVTLLTLALVYCKFRSAIVLTKKTRLVILKVLFLFLATNAAFIGDSIISASIKKYELEIALSIFFPFLNLIFVLPALIVLMYSPNTSCTRICCYCQQQVKRERDPLLPKQSEEAPTNPESVWDHANVPSYTTYHPLEMSDCK